MRHDEVHGPGDLPCRDAVSDLRPAGDDDGWILDPLSDVEDHGCSYGLRFTGGAGRCVGGFGRSW